MYIVYTISELPKCLEMWLYARHTPDSCISMGHTNTRVRDNVLVLC